MRKLTLFDFCSERDRDFKNSTSVQVVGCGLKEEIGSNKTIAGFSRLTPYLTVRPIFHKVELDISCTVEEFSIISKLNLPVIARVCLHQSDILDERETHSQIESDNDGDWAKRGIALSNMLSEHNSETVRLPEKIEETEDSVKLTWSIPQEFERIKAQAKRLKAEKKKWKRDFKALKDWVANFQRIIENAQKSLSIIGDKNEKGTKDEN